MTVSTEISSNEYTGNGVTTDFDYKFRIFKANQLSVITSDADGDNVVTLRLGTDYTVTGANKSAGGKVILTKPLANGHKISIARDIPITQETSFRNQSKFFAETHEDAFDYLTMILQRIWGSLGSLYLKRPNILSSWFDAKGYRIANLGKPKRDSDAVDLGTLKDEISGVNSTILKKEKRTLRVDDMDIAALPKASERAGNVLTFDEEGNPIVVVPATGSAIDVLNQLAKNNGAKLIGIPNGSSLLENFIATTIEQKGAEQFKDNNIAEIQSAINDATFGRTLIAKIGAYNIKSSISLQDRREFAGSGEASVIKWDGGNGTSENQLSIINAKKANPATSAVANTKLREMMIDMNGAENVVAVNAQYLSVQSLFEGVRVQNPGTGSIGFYLSKSWYASMNRVSVRGVEPSRTGTGLYIDTKVGQVNSVPINIQCSALDVGVILDTRNNYMYDVRLTGQIEKCNVGLRHIARRGIRTATISMYFEENKVADVIWGQENEEAGTGYIEQSQQVVWDGCTFNPNSSKVILWEGRHWFRAIDRLKTIEINGAARVKIEGSVSTTIINNTGLPLSQVVEYVPTPTYRPATNTSAINGDTQYILGRQYNALSNSGSVTFDVSKIFNAIGANGQNAKFDVLIRRPYENNSPTCYSGFIQVNSSKEFGLYVFSRTSSSTYVEPEIDTNGAITLKTNVSGSLVYSLIVIPN
ncbi:hypothetical protein ACVXZ3_09985 [Providencia hangzhouensis]|uniref:hypothetical protein n=1 Tax=Providencia rettgeri TaxID=587 RepID=UPI001B372483|nr:hypothetical protein [Providencia rettgeri]MBQ0531321.1 hypothetical protein [Providencia rettgeri]